MSDHFSGPRALAGPAGDICDLFAFPSPERPGPPLDADGRHPLTDLLLDDHLVVDMARPFTEDGYFAIEQAVLDGRAPASCGGRWLDEDVMDTIYSLLITGGRTRISDGVDRATAPAARTFPYLAPPGAQP